MIRSVLPLFLLMLLFPARATDGQENPRLRALRDEVEKLAMEVQSAQVPPLLIAALPAAEKEFVSALGTILLSDARPATRGIKRVSDQIVVGTLLRSAMTPEELATGYALRAYYGRGCVGWEEAARGLSDPETRRNDEAFLLTLAVLPIAPSRLMTDDARRKTLVLRTVQTLEKNGEITSETARGLAQLPLHDLLSGNGCK